MAGLLQKAHNLPMTSVTTFVFQGLPSLLLGVLGHPQSPLLGSGPFGRKQAWPPNVQSARHGAAFLGKADTFFPPSDFHCFN